MDLQIFKALLDVLLAVITLGAIARKPYNIIMDKLDGIIERVEVIEETSKSNAENIAKGNVAQARSVLHSSLSKVEIKQELNVPITDSEIIEIGGQFLEYKASGGNGHMQARYDRLIEKVNHD